MIAGVPDVFVPRRDPLWRPGNSRGYRLDDVAGRLLEPTEYAALLREIEAAGAHGEREIRQAAARSGAGIRSGTGFRGGVDGTFSPTDVGSLVLWLDMQDTLAFTQTGGNVSQFINKKTAVVWAEPTNRAAYSATGLNGFPAMSFNGTSDCYNNTESTVITALTQNKFTILFVPKHAIVDRNNAVLGFGRTDNGNSRGWWGTNTTGVGKWAFDRGNSAGVSTTRSSTANSDTSPHVQEWWDDGSLTSFALDGVLDSSALHSSNFGSLAPTNVLVGSDMLSGGTGDFMQGLVGEILFYRGVLSQTARDLARHYLGAKWSISVV